MPVEPVNAWLDDAIADHLVKNAAMKKHGQYWYRSVSKIGPVAAQRLPRWLSENKLLSTENLPVFPKPNIRLMALEVDIVPMESLMLPYDLTGVSGSNRAHFNKLEARDKFAAIQT